ncbi:hypothetical protein ACQ7HM_21000 [Williamsia sp. MIQD14]|uniref:hypothetical protein n=1 Tax=Williamsia sp. MIQD14 TaxID=3425703 RepID=UPI003DA0EEBB
MAQRSKGKRVQVTTRVPEGLCLADAAAEAGYGNNLSQYVADVLCQVHGKTGLIIGPKNRADAQEMLPLQMTA